MKLALCGIVLLGSVVGSSWAVDNIPHRPHDAHQVYAAEPQYEILSETADVPGIALNASYKLGEKIVVEFKGDTVQDAQSNLSWTLPPTVQSESGSTDGRRLLLWAPAGSYPITLRVQYSLDVLAPDPTDPTKSVIRKLTLPPYEYRTTLVVGDAPPPIIPPGPPQPTPLTGLAALVPDPAKRAKAAEFYADLGTVATNGGYKTTQHFFTAYRQTIAAAQSQGILPKGLVALDQPISDRIQAVLGLAIRPMTPELAKSLSDVFVGVATELSQGL
jgi:hypothetical protein